MKMKERLLFKELCQFKNPHLDEELLAHASPHVLGHLFFNRMQGIAYRKLRETNSLGKVNREFRNSLRMAYEQNCEKNDSFAQCVSLLSDLLKNMDCKVAMLKGAYLCAHYPQGCRTSNDIDLLVSPQEVTVISNMLTEHGFKQGNIRSGVFIEASRKEIIESKMLRGETVPFIKEVNLPYMQYLEVDINFSLDFKSGNKDILSSMLNKTCKVEENGNSIITLSQTDFFLHLCAHLYKEATTLPWIEMRRDMTLYKYSDIYLLLHEMTADDIDCLFARASHFELDKICAYAILQTAALFDVKDIYALKKSTEILRTDPKFLLRVFSPQNGKQLFYRTADPVERFFMTNRYEDLLEELPNETP